MRKSLRIAAAALAGLALQAGAVSITVDQIIFQNTGGDPTHLAGTVDMTLSGSTLTIVLKNTSTATGTDGAFNLLTGLGFSLPNGVTIGSGSAALTAGSTGVNWNNAVLGNNVSQEWGYDNNVTSGPFQDVTTLNPNTSVSSMVASSDTQFQAGELLPPTTLDGPEFGLLSSAVPTSAAGGLNAIRDSVTITINLSGTIPSNLLNRINDGDVVLSFGSPDSGPGTHVPDGGSTMIILGMAMVGLESLRRKLGHKRTA
jgi:hypothetical protein